jgi:hypothetical protein
VPQPSGKNAALTVELLLRGEVQETVAANAAGEFEIRTDLRPFRGTVCPMELRATPFFIPSETEGSDHRRLTVLLRSVKVA